jgi:hypothetical protein
VDLPRSSCIANIIRHHRGRPAPLFVLGLENRYNFPGPVRLQDEDARRLEVERTLPNPNTRASNGFDTPWGWMAFTPAPHGRRASWS